MNNIKEKLAEMINEKLILEFAKKDLSVVTGTLKEVGDDYLILEPFGAVEGYITKAALYPFNSILRLAGYEKILF